MNFTRRAFFAATAGVFLLRRPDPHAAGLRFARYVLREYQLMFGTVIDDFHAHPTRELYDQVAKIGRLTDALARYR